MWFRALLLKLDETNIKGDEPMAKTSKEYKSMSVKNLPKLQKYTIPDIPEYTKCVNMTIQKFLQNWKV